MKWNTINYMQNHAFLKWYMCIMVTEVWCRLHPEILSCKKVRLIVSTHPLNRYQATINRSHNIWKACHILEYIFHHSKFVECDGKLHIVQGLAQSIAYRCYYPWSRRQWNAMDISNHRQIFPFCQKAESCQHLNETIHFFL